MIECSFIPIKKSQYTTDEEVRDGLYSSSVYPHVPPDKWVLCAYLKVDHKKYLDEGLSSKQIIDRCLDFLNYLPEPVRKTKKTQKPKYGFIEPLISKITGEYDIKYKDDRVIVQLVTNDRENVNFWGVGEKL